LPLNRIVVYKSQDGKDEYTLRLTRISYTSIKYELWINDSIIKTGSGSLHGSFFFAAEQEADNKENNVVSCNQYIDSINHFMSIKVEIGTGERVVLYLSNDEYHFDGMIFRKN